MNDILSFILSPYSSLTYLIIRFLFLLASFALLIGIIYLLSKSNYLKDYYGYDIREFFAKEPAALSELAQKWRGIKEKLESRDEADFKMAVMEADSFLNEVLEKMNYKGSVEEKIEQLEIPNLEELKKAHQLKKDISKDPDYRLTREKAKSVLETYEKAFRDLKTF